MAKGYIWKNLPLPAILLAAWFTNCAQVPDNYVTGQDIVRMAPAEPSITSGIADTGEPACCCYSGSNSNNEFPFWIYVTPEDRIIASLSAQISDPRDAYKIAVQWVYVSEEKLNNAVDKWLTPHEFLANTRHYPRNPLKGKEVSDCEEQANALVSLIRARDIPPEEVRVALGEVKFGNKEMGHAWVELLMDEKWTALDASWGPYWDDKTDKLISRQGFDFDYYRDHDYPALQVWAYYNDIYYLDPRDGSGNFPTGWHNVKLLENLAEGRVEEYKLTG